MFPRAGSPPKEGNGAGVKKREEKEDASFEKPQQPRWGELLSPHLFLSMGLEKLTNNLGPFAFFVHLNSRRSTEGNEGNKGLLLPSGSL